MKKLIILIIMVVMSLPLAFAIPTATRCYNFNESSGTIIDSCSGLYNSTSITGSWTRQLAGLINQPPSNYSINSTSYTGIIQTGNAYFNNLASGTNSTIELWVKPLDGSADMALFVSNDPYSYSLRLNAGGVAGRVTLFNYGSDPGSCTINVVNTSLSSANVIHQFVATRAGDTFTLYHNGASIGSCTSSAIYGKGNLNLAGYSTLYYYGQLGPYRIWEGVALNSSEVADLYNSGLGVPMPSVTSTNSFTRTSQVPSDLNSTNLFVYQNLNVSYTIQNISGLVLNSSTPFLNYTISGVSGCWNFQNGTCQKTGFVQSSYVSNSSSSFLFQLSENDVYPVISNAPPILFNQTHTRFGLSDNDIIKWQFLNFTGAKNNNYLEVDELSSDSNGNTQIYACNSSYSNGNPSSTASCVLFQSFANSHYNHSHFNGVSNHTLFSIPVNTTNGRINNVVPVPDGVVWIVFRGATVGTDSVGYVLNSSRLNEVQTSTNNGVSWTSQTWTVDSHIHQYNGSEALNYRACANNATQLFCDTTSYSDNLDVTILPPSSVIVTNPNSTNNSFNRYINITYTASVPSAGASLSKYNISLRDSSENYVVDVQGNNGLNLSYLWETYLSNLTVGSYHLHVMAFDNFSQSSDSESTLFDITANALLNITAYNISVGNNVSVFNVTSLDLNDSTPGFFNTTNGVAFINLVRGHFYNITFTSFNLASISQIYVANQSAFQVLNIATGPLDSVVVNVFNESSGSKILQNTTIVLTNLATTQQYVYSTMSGSQITGSLSHGNYSLIVSSSSPIFYFPRYYLVTVNNNFQSLNTYLAASNNSLLLNVKTSAGTPIENALIEQFVNVNGSVVVAQSVFSDVSGKAQFSYVPFTYYSFVVNASGYNVNSFILNPVLFPSYDVILTSLNQGVTVPTAFTSFGPTSFYKRQRADFNFTIASTYNGLVSYNYNLSGPGVSILHSGINVNGESFSDSFNLTNVTSGQHMTLSYQYVLSNGVIYNRTIVYPINVPLYNQTLQSLGSGRDFGFGLGDKVLIVVFIDIICFGVGFVVFGPMGGLGLSLINTGVFVANGFVPAFMFYSVFVIAVLYMIGRGVDNG